MSFQESETFLDRVEEVARAGADAIMPFWRTLEPHEITEHISELEEKAELVALEHPVIANALAAIGRLI